VKLENKIAVVTGAGRGMGRAMSVRFAKEGAKVVVAEVDETSGKETFDEIKRQGLLVGADISKVSDIDALISKTISNFGRIDIMVNNAGVTKSLGFFDVTEADWDAFYAVNSRGLFFCMQRAAREMVKQKSGKIINIASILGIAHVVAAVNKMDLVEYSQERYDEIVAAPETPQHDHGGDTGEQARKDIELEQDGAGVYAGVAGCLLVRTDHVDLCAERRRVEHDRDRQSTKRKHDQRKRHAGHQPNRRKILHGIVSQLLVERLVDGERGRGRHQQRVAVGIGLGHQLRANDRVGARPVIDEDLLAEILAHLVGNDAGEEIGGPAGREWNDEADLPRRIGLRRRRCGH